MKTKISLFVMLVFTVVVVYGSKPEMIAPKANGDANDNTLSNQLWDTLTTIEYEFVMTGYGGAYQTGDFQYFGIDLDEWVNLGSLTTPIEYGLMASFGCEEEFAAELECDGEDRVLTITYTPAEAGDYVIQGGLTAGASIVNTDGGGFTFNSGNPSAGGPSSVTCWEGFLDACETVTIMIDFTGGSGVGSWSAKSEINGREVTNGYSADQDCP